MNEQVKPKKKKLSLLQRKTIKIQQDLAKIDAKAAEFRKKLDDDAETAVPRTPHA